MSLSCKALIRAIETHAFKSAAIYKVIESRTDVTAAPEFSSCAWAPAEFASGKWDERAWKDPLFLQGDGQGSFLPFGRFSVYRVNLKNKLLVIATGYRVQAPDLHLNTIGYFLLGTSSTCPKFELGAGGSFDVGDTEKVFTNVVSLRNRFYIFSWSEGGPGPRLVTVLEVPSLNQGNRRRLATFEVR
jgi:hypothetical protein